MKIYSSTSLKYFIDNCPKALEFHENDTPRDRDIFQSGIAAHAVVEHVGKKQAKTEEQANKVANAVIDNLITNGHSYYGKQEPPMNPEFAFLGRDLALNYLQVNEIPKGEYEISLAINNEGNACLSGRPEARYRALIDLTYTDVEGDEDFEGNVVVVRDYKTSWQAGENELETLQRKGQAVMAYKHLLKDDTQGIRMEVVNLRSHQVFSKTIWLDGEGEALIEQWIKDILQVCKAADNTRAAHPGYGCLDCPFTLKCKEYIFQDNNHIELAGLEGRRKGLLEMLKIECQEEPAIIPGGFVGYKRQKKNVLTDDAIMEILAAFYSHANIEKESFSSEVALLTALGIGAGQVENIAKTLYPNKDFKAMKDDFLEACLEDKGQIKFGIFKGEPNGI